MIPLKIVLDVGAPALVFLSLVTVGLDLTPADFRRLRKVPGVVAVGVFAPLVALPAIAVALVWWFQPDPFVEAGLILVAACPIGGISNSYSLLARASTALSVALTALSCVVAVVAVPALTHLLGWALRQPIRASAPVALLLLQLGFVVALPVALGMAVRHRWPAWTRARSVWFQRAAFALLGLLLAVVIAVEHVRIASVLWQVVSIAAAFVILSFAAGWASGTVVRASGSDRFTLAAEFATRNIAIATTIAVTMLGRTEFAVFGSVYFLTELPLMLAAVVVWRWRRDRAARRA